MELLTVCISSSFWMGHNVDPQRSKGLWQHTWAVSAQTASPGKRQRSLVVKKVDANPFI